MSYMSNKAQGTGLDSSTITPSITNKGIDQDIEQIRVKDHCPKPKRIDQENQIGPIKGSIIDKGANN